MLTHYFHALGHVCKFFLRCKNLYRIGPGSQNSLFYFQNQEIFLPLVIVCPKSLTPYSVYHRLPIRPNHLNIGDTIPTLKFWARTISTVLEKSSQARAKMSSRDKFHKIFEEIKKKFLLTKIKKLFQLVFYLLQEQEILQVMMMKMSNYFNMNRGYIFTAFQNWEINCRVCSSHQYWIYI